MSMVLIVGLGNIGEEYAKTRHNVGFMFVDMVQKEYGFPEFREKGNYFFSKLRVDGVDVVLMKPTTYMNNSGEAVLAFSSYNKVKPEDIVVVHDDLDLKAGKLKIKRGGGSGGHNGIKSVDKCIGAEYWRVRVGIEHPRDVAPQMDVASYVLGRFSAEQMEKVNATLAMLVKSFDKIVKKDFERILGSFHN